MDDWFSVDVSDPGQDYWNMEPIAPTWDDGLSWGDNTPTYDYSNYDYENYDFQGPSYDEMGYGTGQEPISYPGSGYDSGPRGMDVAYDEEGNLMPGYSLDENNNPQWQGTGYQGTGPEYGQQGPYYGGQPGQPPRAQQPGYGQQPQQRQQPQQPGQPQNKGLLGGMLGGGQGGSGGGFGDILGTLGGLALIGGVGALLGSMLSNKSSGGETPSPISMPGSNLTPTKLANPGVNPGYAMGASAAPVMGSTTSNLGKLISPGAIKPMPPGMM